MREMSWSNGDAVHPESHHVNGSSESTVAIISVRRFAAARAADGDWAK